MGREVFENLDTGVIDYIFYMLLNLMKVDESGFCVVFMLLAQRLNKKERERLCATSCIIPAFFTYVSGC